MNLASLAGLSYEIGDIQGVTPVRTVTHLDRKDVAFDAADPDQAYLDATEAALASAANPYGFPPVGLDRSHDRETYLAKGVRNFPDDGWLWYSDGGIIQNQPLGRTLELVHDLETLRDLHQLAGDRVPPSEGERIFLLVHPGEDVPDDAATSPWFDNARQPSWSRAGLRCLAVRLNQWIYDDLRSIEKINTRLEWIDTIASGVAEGVDNVCTAAVQQWGDGPETVDAMRREIEAAAAAAIDQVLDERRDRALGRQRVAATVPPYPVSDDGLGLAATLADAIRAASGLAGKRRVRVEVVSPAIDPLDSRPAEQQLAGDLLGHFGGFLDVRFRRHDFALGYANMVRWLELALPTFGLPDAKVKVALEAAEREAKPEWIRREIGKTSLWDLGWRDWLELARLAGHAVRVLQHDVRHWAGEAVEPATARIARSESPAPAPAPRESTVNEPAATGSGAPGSE